ncbi:MAG: hypothetical protein N3A57_08040, partial [Negativicutes bacterium]|nr:hypothetical protein [Negativicutes bacterium]
GLYSNSSANSQNSAYRAQVDYGSVDVNTPGSWHAWAAYTNAQALSTWDSNYNDLPGYNNNTGNDLAPNFLGARGWEIGFDYVWAKNIQMEVFYNDYDPTVKQYGGGSTGGTSYQHFRTDFYFYF